MSKKKREGDGEWGGRGKESREKFEVHSIKEEAPSQSHNFLQPFNFYLKFQSFLFFFSKPIPNLKKQKKKKQTNKQTKHIVPLRKSISTGCSVCDSRQ
jgi:hypothetical protein